MILYHYVLPLQAQPTRMERNICLSSLCRSVSLLCLAILSLCGESNGTTQTDTGLGYLYRLEDTQDAWVEYTDNVIDIFPQLLVGYANPFLKTRFLVQFEDIPANCSDLISAKMHVYFLWGQTLRGLPNNPRTLQVHQIIPSWIETQVSAIYRLTSPSQIPCMVSALPRSG